MEVPRCMSWKEFKESLDNMVGKKILYIDEEGTEIPINSDTEFQEALRLAKRQGNRVRFVLVKEPSTEAKSSARQNSKAKEKYAFKDARHSKGWVNDSEYKEAKEAVYVNDAAPEWFLSYMKKFKKELLADVNNAINDTLRKTFKKEAKLYDERLAKDYEWDMANQEMNCVGTQYYYRSDSGYETPAYFVASQPLPASGSVRIRSTDKVYLDQMKDEKRAKQYGKTEKARPNPIDRRVKQDKWMSTPSAAKENGMMTSKAKPYPKVYVTYAHDFGPIKPMKSASFTSNLSLKKLEVLQPYALWFLLGNNGIVPWSNNAYVKCFYNPDEFEFEDSVIDLPSLETGVGANVVYEVTPLKVGSFSFTCAIMDNGVEIGERILCRFEVVDEEGMKVGKSAKRVEPTLKKEAQQLCEHYDDEFTKTQKKIKENIKTIMKRLDDIEVLNSEPKGDSKKKEDDSVKVGQKRNRKKRKEGSTIEFRTGVFDLLQNLESIRENEEGKPKDDEKEIVKEALVGAEDKKEAKEDKNDKHDENGPKETQEKDAESVQKDEGKKEDAEVDKRDSDSELSVIMGSEEDDNFIVLSMPSRTSTPETEVKELENDKDKEQDKENAKEKDKGKDKDATPAPTPKESPREEKKTTLESNTFDPWNEKKSREGGRFDPWNEKKTQPDLYDDEMLKSGKWTKCGPNFVPEGAKKVKKSHIRFFDSFDFPEDVVAKLKSKGMNIEDASYYVAHEATFFNPDILKNENVVYVVDNGGKCVPVVSGRQNGQTGQTGTGYAEAEKRQGSAEAKKRQEISEAKKRQEIAEAKKRQEIGEARKRQEAAEAKRRQEAAEAKKRQESAEAKESQGESSYGIPQGSPTGSEQTKEGMDHIQGKDLPNLLLYSAASDAITKVASVFNNIHSAFQSKGADKKTPTENNKMAAPIKVLEALKILEDMGFNDKIRNRELLMVHNLNLSNVIEELIDKTPRFRDNQPKGIFMSKQGVYGRF